MKSAEEILREYITFNDVNQSQTVELLPLTIIDAMEEYATQCQEDMAKESIAFANFLKAEEIEQLAFLKYPRLINDNPLCRNPNNPMEDDNTYERKIWIGAYTQCQEDMAKLSEWQLCPKCFGEGIVQNVGTSSSMYRTCPVCNGNKTLIKPII